MTCLVRIERCAVGVRLMLDALHLALGSTRHLRRVASLRPRFAVHVDHVSPSSPAGAVVTLSMGSVDDCYDNVLCRGCFATLECEPIERSTFRSRRNTSRCSISSRLLRPPASPLGQRSRPNK